MSSAPASLAKSWAIFIAERFPLPAHLPMVFFFALGNYALAAKLGQAPFQPWPFALAVVLSLSFFFRLRCFDEIKDYAVDVAVNPTRPLARGVLEVPQVKAMLALLTAFEVVVSASQGSAVFAAHMLAVAYSFLMYREFFIGPWLRPHLTTYALTHTLVSVWLGLSIAVQAAGHGLEDLGQRSFIAAGINWFMFNLFEFARKTFAEAEERPHVESYSSLFGRRKAVLLSLSQIALALVCLYLAGATAPGLPADALAAAWLLTLLPAAAAGYFALRGGVKPARLMRGAISAYLILFYALLSWLGLA